MTAGGAKRSHNHLDLKTFATKPPSFLGLTGEQIKNRPNLASLSQLQECIDAQFPWLENRQAW
jgi:hypothetical protein